MLRITWAEKWGKVTNKNWSTLIAIPRFQTPVCHTYIDNNNKQDFYHAPIVEQKQSHKLCWLSFLSLQPLGLVNFLKRTHWTFSTGQPWGRRYTSVDLSAPTIIHLLRPRGHIPSIALVYLIDTSICPWIETLKRKEIWPRLARIKYQLVSVIEYFQGCKRTGQNKTNNS